MSHKRYMIKKIRYIHITDSYSAIQMNRLLIHIATWIDVKGIKLCGEKKSI